MNEIKKCKYCKKDNNKGHHCSARLVWQIAFEEGYTQRKSEEQSK